LVKKESPKRIVKKTENEMNELESLLSAFQLQSNTIALQN
jgi:hypothetical protein